jgi:hypothetical protein
MNNQWVQASGNWYLREVSQNQPSLRPAVYKLNYNLQTNEMYLTEIQNSFELPFKVYGIENGFINRVVKTYDNTTGNLGILLNGVKGTGKTVTSKQICNKLNLPVIIVHSNYDGVPSFINSVQQDVIIMIDEYEKIYREKDYSVLTVMDGVLDNGFRKVFLLTTNELYINTNMLQRPGRIRYLKTFKDLPLSVINEIVDDMLIYPEHRTATIEAISELETITVDIVKAIVSEVNLHNEVPADFLNVFNVKKIDNKFDIIKIIPGREPKIVKQNAEIDPKRIDKNSRGRNFYADGDYLGEIKKVVSDNLIIVNEYVEVGDDDDDEVQRDVQYQIEKARTHHPSFLAF